MKSYSGYFLVSLLSVIFPSLAYACTPAPNAEGNPCSGWPENVQGRNEEGLIDAVYYFLDNANALTIVSIVASITILVMILAYIRKNK